MSGPKSSRYILTPQQLRRLAQIREREQTIQQQRSRLEYLRTRLSTLKMQLQQALEKTELLLKRTGTGTEEQQRITKALANIETAVREAQSAAAQTAVRERTAAQLEAAVKRAKAIKEAPQSQTTKTAAQQAGAAVETAAQEADKAAQQELAKLRQAVQIISTIVEQSQALQMQCSSPDWEVTKQLTADIEHNIVQGMNLRIEEQIKKPLTPIERRRQKINEILQKAEQLFNLSLYCPAIRQKIEQLRQESEEIRQRAGEITSTAFLDNYCAMTALPFLETCEEFSQLAAQSGREYEELLARYQYDCQYLGLPEEPPAFSAAGIEQLRDTVQQLEAQCDRSQAQQYIAESLDEVMRDMGYPVIGSREVTKRSGKKFRSELYHFSEGIVVNVTYSASGQISMELGGADDCSRAPTDAECEQLCQEMKEFCGTFSEIELRLKEKGILPERRLSMLPPEADYAQIIDVSGYQLTEPVAYFAAEEEQQQKRRVQEAPGRVRRNG